MSRILIVDDEPMIAMLAQDWLEDLGHEAIGPAYDLSTALHLANESMDAAILDLSLGREKSYEVARRLRARAIPFAFATGHAPEAKGSEFEDAVTLPKPFSFETFRDVVAELILRKAVNAA
jgi:DNA-binding response OmpR family regulator